jgi:anti-anti-sigma regulatory factor
LGCIVGILLVWQCPSLRERYHVEYLGAIPEGIFPVSITELHFNFAFINKFKATAISIALISFMESIAVSQALATQHGYSINPSQELLALGVTNVICSMFSGMVATGSFSRTAVANSSGAQTQLAGVVLGISLLLVLSFLTPLFYYLPMFALAAVVIKAVINLVAYDVAISLWKVKRWDFLLWLTACLGTLFIGPLEGIGISVSLSILVVIYESARPQLVVLWRLPGTKLYRSTEQEGRGERIPNILIIRLSASLYFGNVAYVKDRLLQRIQEASMNEPVYHLVLEMCSVRTVDSTAVHLLKDIVADLRGRGIRTVFTMVGPQVMKTFDKAQFVSFIGEDLFFPAVNDAVQDCLRNCTGNSSHVCSPVGGECPPEVGISNCIHQQYTQASVFVPRAITGLTGFITSVCVNKGCSIERAQADHTHHTYHLLKGGGKLSDEDMNELSAHLQNFLREMFQRPQQGDIVDAIVADSPGHISPVAAVDMDLATLEEVLVAERLRVAAGELARERIQALEAAIALRQQP